MGEVKLEPMFPMMLEGERDFLDGLLKELPPDGRVTEWGSGGSTPFILDRLRGEQHLTSIEHSIEWFERVAAHLSVRDDTDRITYANVTTRAPYFTEHVKNRDEGDRKLYIPGYPQEELAAFNSHYVDPERCDDIRNVFDADLYLVDGISRGAVLATVFRKARKRPCTVLLHDYPGREEWYDWAVALELQGKTADVVHNFLVMKLV